MAHLDPVEARTIAEEWVAAFNSRDIEAILSHYAESIELTSRLVTRTIGDPGATVRGKPALRAYFTKAMAGSPDLRFELLDVFTGVRSIAVYFRSNTRGLQLEVMEIGDDGRVTRVLVHHRDPP
jgi:hypothetical protein